MGRLTVLLVALSLGCVRLPGAGAPAPATDEAADETDPSCESSRVTLKIVNDDAADYVIYYLPGGTLRIRVGPLSTITREVPRGLLDGADFGFYVRQAAGYDRDGPEVVDGAPIQCDVGTLKIFANGDAVYFGTDVQ